MVSVLTLTVTWPSSDDRLASPSPITKMASPGLMKSPVLAGRHFPADSISAWPISLTTSGPDWAKSRGAKKSWARINVWARKVEKITRKIISLRKLLLNYYNSFQIKIFNFIDNFLEKNINLWPYCYRVTNDFHPVKIIV
jgi:hypothetical protein